MGDKTVICYWRYDDGWTETPEFNTSKHIKKEFRKEVVGWHCWVYPANNGEFVKWMKDNMKGQYDCTHRFNSGDPMFTVNIRSDEDATIFKLKWL